MDGCNTQFGDSNVPGGGDSSNPPTKRESPEKPCAVAADDVPPADGVAETDGRGAVELDGCSELVGAVPGVLLGVLLGVVVVVLAVGVFVVGAPLSVRPVDEPLGVACSDGRLV